MISKLIHGTLSRCGYWTRRTNFLPLGIDYILDIHRISNRYGISIETIVDIGAHTGESTEAFNARWPKAKLYAIEADPSTYAQLIWKPISRHAECLNLAMSDYQGRA